MSAHRSPACCLIITNVFFTGYDVGITGGVTSFQNFLERFFPAVANKTENHSGDKWCTYNDAGLQMFTSSLFLAACVAGLVASPITR